jgi:hypothetical protein
MPGGFTFLLRIRRRENFTDVPPFESHLYVFIPPLRTISFYQFPRGQRLRANISSLTIESRVKQQPLRAERASR